MLMKYLNPFIYNAKMGKIHFSIQEERGGLEFKISGFSDKMQLFIKELSNKII